MPLVKQQAEYIKENTNLKVKDYCGDNKGIDHWDKEEWYHNFDTYHVLVMSRQIFLDTLNRGIIKPRQLNLIIFDECHHASKNDPYVQIMKVIKDAPVEERPRILGLSASLLGTKVKPGELNKGVKKLESALMCRARTSKDLNDVVKYATSPEEVIVNYKHTMDAVSSELMSLIKLPLEFSRRVVQEQKKKKRCPDTAAETAKNLLEDLVVILEDLGPATAADFVNQALMEMKNTITLRGWTLESGTSKDGTSNDRVPDEDKFSYKVSCLALTHLTLFKLKCDEFKQRYSILQDSDKVKCLLLQLADRGVQMGEADNNSSPNEKRGRDSRLRGIIFVQRRYTASCLSDLINRKARADEDLRHLKCDYVVGHNIGQTGTSMKRKARMKSKGQDQVLSKFRKGSINLLVATSVIEEGVDVPRCNLVVRFDLPQNFRAFVQSKGRARDKPSTFLLMIGNHESDKNTMLRDFHCLEEELIKICQEDRAVPSEEEIQHRMMDRVPPYMPYGRDGARATIGNSLTILHR